MKNEKQIKELLKEAYNSNDVCDKWKDKILKVYPKAKENVLEVGKWYKSEVNKALFYITNINNEDVNAFGFNYLGEWTDADDWFSTTKSKSICLAKEEEVEQALIKEAKKRGFKRGVRFKSISGNDSVFTDFNYLYGLRTKCAIDGVYSVIFRHGKWATITETITKEEAEKQLGKTII